MGFQKKIEKRTVPESEPRLIEDIGAPVVYCDGPAKVSIEGANVRIVFFEYRRFEGERVRVSVLEMVRPLASLGNLSALIAIATAEYICMEVHFYALTGSLTEEVYEESMLALKIFDLTHTIELDNVNFWATKK